VNKIKWSKNTRKYCNGEIGKLGKYEMFTIDYDGVSGGEYENPYILYCKLPGIKNNLGHFDVEVAKRKAENTLNHWLKESGLIELVNIGE